MKTEEKVLSGIMVAGAAAAVYLVVSACSSDDSVEVKAGKKAKKMAKCATKNLQSTQEKVEEKVAETSEKARSFADDILDKLADYAVSNRDQLSETVKSFLKK